MSSGWVRVMSDAMCRSFRPAATFGALKNDKGSFCYELQKLRLD